MRVINGQLMLVACLSLIIGACSSSNGASPTQSDGASGGDTGGDVLNGVSTTGGGTNIVGAAPVPEMQGEWGTGCLQRDSIFSQTTLSVVGARVLMELSAFSDQACTEPVLLGEVINGSTTQRHATTVPTGTTRRVSLGDAIEVNIHYEQGTVDNKPLTTSEFPGREEYLEKIEYDIVLVDGDALYFGDTKLDGYAGDSAQTRPISLNTLAIFNRLP